MSLELDENDDMEVYNDLSFISVLNNLLTKDNLEFKTHIFKPKQIAVLKIIGNFFKERNFPISSQIILDFIEYYLTYMVSYNRESRKEIIKALTHLIDDESDNKKRITDTLE